MHTNKKLFTQGESIMKKIISLVLAVLMLTCVFASCGAKKGQTLEDIKKSGELVVYTEAGFAPFEFVYNNEVSSSFSANFGHQSVITNPL